MTITTIGLDLAKSVFQAHGIDESGATVLVKKLHRKQMLPFFSKLMMSNDRANGEENPSDSMRFNRAPS